MIPTAYPSIVAHPCVPYTFLSSIISGAQNFGHSTSLPTLSDRKRYVECLDTRGLVYRTQPRSPVRERKPIIRFAVLSLLKSFDLDTNHSEKLCLLLESLGIGCTLLGLIILPFLVSRAIGGIREDIVLQRGRSKTVERRVWLRAAVVTERP